MNHGHICDDFQMNYELNEGIKIKKKTVKASFSLASVIASGSFLLLGSYLGLFIGGSLSTMSGFAKNGDLQL